jgi:hypothetical protein
LERVHLELLLSHTRVAAGNQRGRRGDEYVKGRVDKAVLEVVEDDPHELGTEIEARAGVPIGLVAEIIKPYAVFLRN